MVKHIKKISFSDLNGEPHALLILQSMHTDTKHKYLGSIPFLYDFQNQSKHHMHHQNASVWTSSIN